MRLYYCPRVRCSCRDIGCLGTEFGIPRIGGWMLTTTEIFPVVGGFSLHKALTIIAYLYNQEQGGLTPIRSAKVQRCVVWTTYLLLRIVQNSFIAYARWESASTTVSRSMQWSDETGDPACASAACTPTTTKRTS